MNKQLIIISQKEIENAQNVLQSILDADDALHFAMSQLAYINAQCMGLKRNIYNLDEASKHVKLIESFSKNASSFIITAKRTLGLLKESIVEENLESS